MDKKTKKIGKVFAIIGGVILVGWVFLFIAERLPMGFVNTIDVTNNLDEDVYITPVGQIQGSEGFMHLRNQNESFNFTLPESYHISLKDSETTRIHYDNDDITFKFLIIETTSGKIYVKSASSPLQATDDVLTIDDLQKLEECPPEYIPCTEGKAVDIERP